MKLNSVVFTKAIKRKAQKNKTEQKKIKHICTGKKEQQYNKERNKESNEKKMVKLFVIKLFILSIIILEENKVQT